MNQLLNILLVEDSEDDAFMILREFEKNGIRVHSERVQSSATLNDALEREPWDLVISDYRMPRFSGMTALAIVRTRFPKMPFILLSGVIEERVANVAMMTGASAFTAKHDIHQLVPLAKRELKRAAATVN